MTKANPPRKWWIRLSVEAQVMVVNKKSTNKIVDRRKRLFGNAFRSLNPPDCWWMSYFFVILMSGRLIAVVLKSESPIPRKSKRGSPVFSVVTKTVHFDPLTEREHPRNLARAFNVFTNVFAASRSPTGIPVNSRNAAFASCEVRTFSCNNLVAHWVDRCSLDGIRPKS